MDPNLAAAASRTVWRALCYHWVSRIHCSLRAIGSQCLILSLIGSIISTTAAEPLSLTFVRENGEIHANESLEFYADAQLIGTGKTDDQGQFRFEESPATSSRIYLRTDPFYAYLDPSIVDQKDAAHRRIMLTYLDHIGGHVTYADGTTPAHQVEFLLRGTTPRGDIGMHSIRSQADGNFYFQRLDPGQYTVICEEGRLAHLDSNQVNLSIPAKTDPTPLRFVVPSSPRGTWEHFSYLEGLPNSDISVIAPAHDGVMWIGTHRGLARYDGENFESFLVPKNQLTYLIHTIHAKSETVWASSDKSIYRFDGNEFIAFRQQAIWQDEAANHYRQVPWVDGTTDGVIWFGTNAKEFFRFDGKNLETVEPPSVLPRKTVRRAYIDPSDRIWWLADTGLYRFNPEGKIAESYLTDLSKRTVRDVYFSPRGSICIATSTGAHRFSAEGIETFTGAQGLPHWETFTAFESANGDLYIGTEHGIGSVINGKLRASIVTADLVHARVKCIREGPNGCLWIGTGLGLSRYDMNQMIDYRPADGYPDSHVESIFIDAPNVWWVGVNHADKNLYLIENGLPRIFNEGVLTPRFSINAIYRDSKKRLWVDAYHGVTSTPAGEYPGGANDVRYLSFLQHLHDITDDQDGNIYLATSRFLFTEPPEEEAPPKPTIRRVNSDLCYAIGRDEFDTLWLATSIGLYRQEEGEFEMVLPIERERWCKYRSPDGTLYLASNQECLQITNSEPRVLYNSEQWQVDDIEGFVRDRQGRFWVATHETGVKVYDGTLWSSIDSRDGLRGNYASCIALSDDQSLLIGTYYGMNRYRPNRNQPITKILSVANDIATATANDAARSQYYTQERLSIAYTSQDFKTVSEKRTFRYRVGNDDAPWSDPTTQRIFDWTPQQPGKHRVQVQAIDRDLNYSEPATIVFTIIHPWFRNPTIIIPAGLSLLALVSGLGWSLFGNWRQRQRSLGLQRNLLQQETLNRKRLEERNQLLVKANEKAEAANRAKSTFLANMSHEIRTPLNAVLGYARILQNRLAKQPEFLPPLVTIEQNGRNLLGLINEILDLSKIEAGQIELKLAPFRLTDLIDELNSSFHLAYKEKGIQLECSVRFETAPTNLMGDVNKIRQILANLLSNALKFTEQGTVELIVSIEPKPSVSTNDSTNYRFEIADSGTGIRPEELETIFQPFEQGERNSPKPGSGLGLAIVRRYVDQMGGTIDVRSEYGHGATFTVILPLSNAPSEASKKGLKRPHEIPQFVPTAQCRALVVDDIQTNRNVLSDLLETMGASVLQAEGGQKAIDILQNEKVDIVFMDVRMPGMSGTEAIRLIQQQFGPTKPILVAVSASVLVDEQAGYREAGFHDIVGKPVQLEALVGCLKSQLGITFTEPIDTPLPERQPLPALPSSIAQRIEAAVSVQNLTQIEDAIQLLRGEGPQHHATVERLIELLEELNTQGIQDLVTQLREDEPN